MLVILSDLTIVPRDVDHYIALRREFVDPVMLEQPGFKGVTLLYPQVPRNGVSMLMCNKWADEAAARSWGASVRHEEVSSHVRPLVRSIASRFYERVDDASTRPSESEGQVAWISLQHVREDRLPDYLAYRHQALDPRMIGASGFASASLLREAAERHRFAVYCSWASDAHVRAHFGAPVENVEAHGVAEFVEQRPLTASYDVVAVTPSLSSE